MNPYSHTPWGRGEDSGGRADSVADAWKFVSAFKAAEAASVHPNG
ncbi:MAG: hypothetical protein V1738_03250 [Patescibacteria group bacterium]